MKTKPPKTTTLDEEIFWKGMDDVVSAMMAKRYSAV